MVFPEFSLQKTQPFHLLQLTVIVNQCVKLQNTAQIAILYTTDIRMRDYLANTGRQTRTKQDQLKTSQNKQIT